MLSAFDLAPFDDPSDARVLPAFGSAALLAMSSSPRPLIASKGRATGSPGVPPCVSWVRPPMSFDDSKAGCPLCCCSMNSQGCEERVDAPLRWAGSKRALVPKLKGMLPSEVGRYLEPFAGSACLFFELAPPKAVLSDFNKSLISTYRSVKSHPTEVADVLETLHQGGDDYYAVRKLYNSKCGPHHRAAYFLYLNRFGFNGVYRTNRQGEYNVPRGTRTGRLLGRNELIRISKRLKGVRLLAADFSRVMQMAEEGDLLYVDPPYVTTHRSTYGEYGYGSFAGESDLNRMRSELRSASDRGVNILLSFGSREPFEDLLDGWNVIDLSTPRRISANLPSRSTRYSEIIATNYAIRGL